MSQPSRECAPPAAEAGPGEVEAVLSSLGALDDLPVADHVAVFDQVSESLRRALTGASDFEPAAGRG